MNKIIKMCFGIITVGVIGIYIFKIPLNNILIYIPLLLCPLMHLFMMNHGEHSEKSQKHNPKDHTQH